MQCRAAGAARALSHHVRQDTTNAMDMKARTLPTAGKPAHRSNSRGDYYPTKTIRSSGGPLGDTKTCEFMGFGAKDVTKPYKFIRFGVMGDTARKTQAPIQSHGVRKAARNNIIIGLPG